MMVTESSFIQSAPGDLEIVRRFVNTLDIEAGTDELDSPAALLAWLRGAGLAVPEAAGEARQADVRCAAADLVRSVALREALRVVLRSHVASPGKPASAQPSGAAADLRKIAANLPIRIDVGEDGQIALAAAGPGTAAGLARILLIVAEASFSGTWPRLKVCSASDCQWAFYDRSPTRSGCWCSMRVCGSRAKSRAYRRRTAARTNRPVAEGVQPPALVRRARR
jgi:predicted RNA-binding Zn ribbon-like protein